MAMHVCPSGHRWEAAMEQETPCPVCTSLGGELLPPAPKPKEALPQVPGYEVLELIGQGGMGIVYKARQVSLNRVVALKLIQARLDAFGPRREEMRARFRTEAEAIARLSHPNVVQVYEVGEWLPGDGRPPVQYLALEYVAGGSLTDRLRDMPLAPKVAAQLVETLARAMHAAHEKGVVHRDLKPDNVLMALGREPLARMNPTLATSAPVGEAVPKITDFGLARFLGEGPGLTDSNAVVGTPSFMAPEQARPGAVKGGPLADVWALGAILYACLTGRPPFLAATTVETLMQVVQDDPAPPARLNAKVPRDLENIVLKCLRKDFAERYQSAAALADDLERFRLGKAVEARPLNWETLLIRWAWRNPLPASLVGLLFFTMAAGLFAVLAANARERGERRRAEDRERQTLDLLASVISRVVEDPRFRLVGVEPMRKEMAEDLLSRVEQYQQRSREAGPGGQMFDVNVGDLWRGNLSLLAGKPREALEILRDATEHSSIEKAWALEALAKAQHECGKQDDAMATWEQICHLGRAAAEDKYRFLDQPVARAHLDRGLELLRRSEWKAAREELLASEKWWDRVLAGWKSPQGQAGRLSVEVALGAVALQENALDEAIRRYETARAGQARLVADNPGMRPFVAALSTTCHQLAGAYLRLNRNKEAQAALDEARAAQSALLQASPDAQTFNRYQADFAVMAGRLGLKTGQAAKAQASFQEAFTTLEELAKATKDSSLAAPRLRAATYLGLTQMASLTQRAKARTSFASGLDRLKETAADPGPSSLRDLGETAYLLGSGLRLLGEPAKGVVASEQSVKWLRIALERAPTSREVRLELNRSLYELAGGQRLLNKHAEAAATCRERVALWPTDAAQLRDGAGELCECAGLTKEEKQRQAYLDEALAVFRKAVQAGLKNATGVRKEKDFTPLHGRPEFEALLAEVAKRDEPRTK